MRSLPSGFLTFCFTDVEGSTRLFQDTGEAFPDLLAEHHRLVTAAFEKHGGTIIKTEGDGIFAVFTGAREATEACSDAQRALFEAPWPEGRRFRSRMGLHSGEARPAGDDYIALAVHQAARVAAAAHGGQTLLSAATFEALSGGIPPGAMAVCLGSFRLKDFDKPEDLYDLRVDGLPLVTTSPGAPPVLAGLRLAGTSFVGRDAELAELAVLVAERRLVSVTGLGGIGKSRLATRVAAEAVRQFPDGVWPVELAPISADADVAVAIGTALGIREVPGKPPTEPIIAKLAPRRLLLLLDNCEHVADGVAAFLTRLLGECRQCHVLTTSRVPLELSEESVFALAPLGLPEPSASAAESFQFDATRLFVERARRTSSDFELTEQNCAVVNDICRRLDGMPLALEMAAARLRQFPLEDIRDRLKKRFSFLRHERRQRGARQETLRAVIDWAYELLDKTDRSVFERISLFRTSWRLSDALALCDDLEEEVVVDAIASLVDRSLIVKDPGETGSPPYRMLETVREFASEALSSSGERGAARDRFIAWAMQLVGAGGYERVYPMHVLNEISHHYSNVLAAFSEAVAAAPSRPDDVHRIAIGLDKFWKVKGLALEGLRTLRVATGCAGARADLHAYALGFLSKFESEIGDLDAALTLADRALDLAGRSNDVGAMLNAMSARSAAFRLRHEFAASRSEAERLLDLAAEHHSIRAELEATNDLGIVAFFEDRMDDAVGWYERSLECARRMGDSDEEARNLFNVGEALAKLGRTDQAIEVLQSAGGLSALVGNRAVELPATVLLADLVMDAAEAASLRARARALAGELGPEMERRGIKESVPTSALAAESGL